MVTSKNAPTKAPVTKQSAAKRSVTEKSATTKASAKKAPWDRDNPKAATGDAAHHLTPAQKAAAKRAAKKAGRPYPNLVDNMQAARKAAKK